MLLSCPRLLDILNQLPGDVLRENVWLHLTSEHSDPSTSVALSHTLGRAFRRVCRGSRRLTDQLTRRLHLDLGEDDSLAGEDAAQRQHVFLARQEGLEELSLTTSDRGVAEGDIIQALRLGAAHCQHLQVLHLMSNHGCTAAAGDVVRQCCPHICELKLVVASDPAAFLAVLRTCHRLATVDMHRHGHDEECGGAVAALAALPPLRSLSLAGRLDRAYFESLALLGGVSELRLCSLDVGLIREQGAHLGRVLGAMTQLTTLEVPDWFLEVQEEYDLQQASDRLDARVAQLGGLCNLQSLTVNALSEWGAVLCDGAADTLRRLTALTHLSCPPVVPRRGAPLWPGASPTTAGAAAAAGAGQCLPQLRDLQVPHPSSLHDLAAAIHLLRPLSLLRHATFEVTLDTSPALVLPNGGDDVHSLEQQGAAAAWALSTALAAAPRLRRIDLTLSVSSPVEPPAVSAVPALLLQLRGWLVTLILYHQSVGVFEALWPILCTGPSSLEALRLSCCRASLTGLVAVVQCLPGLRYLGVNCCQGVSGDSAVALAAARVAPLCVGWRPELNAVQALAFQAAAGVGVKVVMYTRAALV